MILVIDNYDSFVHTLSRYVRCYDRKTKIVRNDKISIAQVRSLQPEAIILSPGPGHPKDAGICVDLIREVAVDIPILGVCLGHQAIVCAYGGVVDRAKLPMHGRSGNVLHNGRGIFLNLPKTIQAARYHSLCAIELPSCLIQTASSDEDEIMAIEHKLYPVWGVQFHPESVLTPDGMVMIKNFLNFVDFYHNEKRGNNRCFG